MCNVNSKHNIHYFLHFACHTRIESYATPLYRILQAYDSAWKKKVCQGAHDKFLYDQKIK